MTDVASSDGILSVQIKDKAALYAAYMPFVVNGGLFIPTQREYAMGEEVFMLLKLMQEAERLAIAGKVIWKTPAGAEGYRVTGIGVQFSSKDGNIKHKIESYLAGALESIQATHTL